MEHWTRTYQSYEVVQYQAGGVAPHGLTQRTTYAVPSNKYAVIQNIHCYMMRQSTATTAGMYYIKIAILLGGVTECTILLPISGNNTVYATTFEQLPSPIYLRPGDVIKIWTADTSTGGTVAYSAVILLTTYL